MKIKLKIFIYMRNYTFIFLPMFLFLSLLFNTKLLSSNQEPQSSPLPSQDVCVLENIDLNEDSYTNKDWLVRFLELSTPMNLDISNIPLYKQKLLTTQVFVDVSIDLKYKPSFLDESILNNTDNINTDTDENEYEDRKKDSIKSCSLSFNLKEKWTLVPVLRGVFGGGTPLLVYGLFDTHTFGSLWTLGAEVHTYGNASPGGVIWAKAPRWLNGKYSLSLELWNKNTILDLYDLDKKNVGTFKNSWKGFHGVFLAPMTKSNRYNLQLGLDYFYKKHSTDVIETDSINIAEEKKQEQYDILKNYFSSNGIDFYTNKTKSSLLNFKLIYDDVNIDNFYFDGLRVDLGAGGGNNFWDHNASFNTKLEIFYYKLFSNNLNIAYHLFSGYTKSSNINDFYKLGGFDSIRGYPDGFMYGNRALYSNLEFRKTLYIGKWFDLQGTLFTDFGSASIDKDNFWNNKELSYGAGVKIIVPSIYKLMIRVDYAIGIDGSQGFSISCSDFFNAYKVL